MSQGYSAPTPTATWNRARGVWETNQQAICGHLEPYSQTWPKWGSMRNGEVYEQPTPAHPTADSVCSSLLPTPQAHDAVAGKTPEQVAAMRARTGPGVRNLNEEIHLLPTPVADNSRGLPSAQTDYQSLPNAVADLT